MADRITIFHDDLVRCPELDGATFRQKEGTILNDEFNPLIAASLALGLKLSLCRA